MEKITYKITDKNGIHARPAGLIVKSAKQFKSSVTLKCGDRQADSKKLFQIMQMGIKAGEELVIVADGTDEREAISDMERTLRAAGL